MSMRTPVPQILGIANFGQLFHGVTIASHLVYHFPRPRFALLIQIFCLYLRVASGD